MSLLWPETIVAGLFPGGCWLQRGGAELATAGTDQRSTPPQLLAALDAMLAGLPKPLAKRTRIQLLVSDSVASVVQLPWQDLLRSEAEQHGYAMACYERHGMQMTPSWAMQTGFRRFGAPGLAWALPQAWLQDLAAQLEQRGLRLASVLPVSAAAYWRLGGAAARGNRLVLLRENGRLTGLVYRGGQLRGMDVQPVAGGEAASLLRLLKRVGAAHEAPAHVDEWNATGDEPLANHISECFPDAVQRVLPRLAWS